MIFRLCIVAALSIATSAPAAAQFSQFIGFGDSTVDSGWYRNTTTGEADRDKRIAAAVAAGGRGTPVGVGSMSSELLAGYFGLSALPANQAGGTNFATGGARDSQSTAGSTAVPTVTQIENYLGANGGRATVEEQLLMLGEARDSPRPEVQRPRERVQAPALLTAKEGAILELLSAGMSNKEIARAVDVGQETVKWHLKNLFGKLNAGSRRHAVDRVPPSAIQHPRAQSVLRNGRHAELRDRPA